MLHWHPVVDFPKQYIWVLAFQSKQLHITAYIPYIVVYRDGDKWISSSGDTIDDITYWAYINSPPINFPPSTQE